MKIPSSSKWNIYEKIEGYFSVNAHLQIFKVNEVYPTLCNRSNLRTCSALLGSAQRGFTHIWFAKISLELYHILYYYHKSLINHEYKFWQLYRLLRCLEQQCPEWSFGGCYRLFIGVGHKAINHIVAVYIHFKGAKSTHVLEIPIESKIEIPIETLKNSWTLGLKVKLSKIWPKWVQT